MCVGICMWVGGCFFIFVFMFVCMCAYLYVCIRIYVCVCMWLHACSFVCMSVFVSAYVCVYTHVCVSICMYMCMCMGVCVQAWPSEVCDFNLALTFCCLPSFLLWWTSCHNGAPTWQETQASVQQPMSTRSYQSPCEWAWSWSLPSWVGDDQSPANTSIAACERP